MAASDSSASLSHAVIFLAVLRLQVAVLDVEVTEDVAVRREEVLADRHEVEQGLDVAVRQLLRVAIERVEALGAHERRDEQREHERAERDAEARRELEVGEESHGRCP
jgi:hypothetical protein